MPEPLIQTTVSSSAKQMALDRLRLYLNTEYPLQMQEEIVQEVGGYLTQIGNRVVLMHWFVREGAVHFLDADARSPCATVVSTEYSRDEINEFVQVFNAHMLEPVRLGASCLGKATRGWVFQMAVQDARRLFPAHGFERIG